MRLPLDHIPFICNSRSVLERSFSDLGFRCSPPGEYRSREYPGVVWMTACVFFAHGWFDLLESSQATDRGVPGGCLFIADDLAPILEATKGISPTSKYSLDRRWHHQEGVGEHFELVSFREKICRLPVSVIQHRWPCDDAEASWSEHPNSAIGLKSVICSSAKAIERSPLTEILDVTQAQDVPSDEFQQRFGRSEHPVAISVQVENSSAVATHLAATSLPHANLDDRVLAYPPNLDCVFEFVL